MVCDLKGNIRNEVNSLNRCVIFTIMCNLGFYCVVVIMGFTCDVSSFVIPEDVATSFAAIYGFAPPIHKGNDHRIGFGFRFGNHADFQILYEFGPQTVTKPLQPSTKIRSASYRQLLVRRRPLLEILLKAGILRSSHAKHVITEYDSEPR